MKRCSKCGIKKPLDEFYKRKTSLDGKRADCKACFLIACKARYQRNRESKLEYQRKHYSENRAARLSYHSCWRKENVEHLEAYERGRRSKKRRYNCKYYRDNQEREAKRYREYVKSNPAVILDKNRRYRGNRAGADGEHTQEEFHEVCERFGWACLRCGVSHLDSPLTVDHVIPLSKGGSDSILNVQPLCLSCNSAKKDRVIDYRGRS